MFKVVTTSAPVAASVSASASVAPPPPPSHEQEQEREEDVSDALLDAVEDFDSSLALSEAGESRPHVTLVETATGRVLLCSRRDVTFSDDGGDHVIGEDALWRIGVSSQPLSRRRSDSGVEFFLHDQPILFPHSVAPSSPAAAAAAVLPQHPDRADGQGAAGRPVA